MNKILSLLIGLFFFHLSSLMAVENEELVTWETQKLKGKVRSVEYVARIVNGCKAKEDTLTTKFYFNEDGTCSLHEETEVSWSQGEREVKHTIANYLYKKGRLIEELETSEDSRSDENKFRYKYVFIYDKRGHLKRADCLCQSRDGESTTRYDYETDKSGKIIHQVITMPGAPVSGEKGHTANCYYRGDLSYHYNETGLLADMEDSHLKTSYAYDQAGHLMNTVSIEEGDTTNISYQYDQQGNVVQEEEVGSHAHSKLALTSMMDNNPHRGEAHRKIHAGHLLHNQFADDFVEACATVGDNENHLLNKMAYQYDEHENWITKVEVDCNVLTYKYTVARIVYY